MTRSLALSALVASVFAFPALVQGAPQVTSQGAFAGTAGARILVVEGRALVRDEDSSHTLLRNQEHSTANALQLEVGAGSRVEIQWNGLASMQVWGPTSMEWKTDTAGALAWDFAELAWVDLEVRRGEHRLDLPGAWRTSVGGGALHLRGLPSGPTELRHHAGRPLSLEWRGSAEHVRPPVAVYPGSSLRLEPLAGHDRNVQAGSQTQERPVAVGTRVPSGPVNDPRTAMNDSHHGRVVDNAELATRPGSQALAQPRHVTQGKEPEFVERGAVRSTVKVTPKETMQGATGMDAGRSTSADVPLHEARDMAKKSQAAPTKPSDIQSGDDPWRGIRFENMMQAGPLVIERSADIEVRVTAAGSWKILLDSTAQAPIWCFGPTQDVQISPGGVVTFSGEGDIRLKFGDVDVRQAPAWRQAPALE